MKDERLTYYEFFAGGGMARLGLGENWTCEFANDICPKKGTAYKNNFQPANELLIEDINKVSYDMLPDHADLAWASFPCQDLSLAGNNGGIHAPRSGTFWAFAKLITELKEQRRPVPLLVIENVAGLITSKKGNDFKKVISTLVDMGYRVGPLIIDAVNFVPQSRPRLFVACVFNTEGVPDSMISADHNPMWHTKALVNAYNRLPKKVQRSWIWWNLPVPNQHVPDLKDIIESKPTGVKWHTQVETKKLLSMMSPTNRRKLQAVKKMGTFEVGTIYKRTRKDEQGNGIQRAEVRFDGISGCLRTPAGGSSRQLIMTVEANKIRSRLLSPREAARLMGVPDTYVLPERYNDAYKVMGDGLAVPAVHWLQQHILTPIARQRLMEGAA